MEFNPYEPPKAIDAQKPEDVEPKGPVDITWTVRKVRAMCVVYIVFGMLLAPGPMVAFGPPEPGRKPLPTLAKIYLSANGLAGLIALVSAVGVLRKRRWSLPFSKAMSILFLPAFPAGTLMGGGFLLNIAKVKLLFQQPQR